MRLLERFRRHPMTESGEQRLRRALARLDAACAAEEEALSRLRGRPNGKPMAAPAPAPVKPNGAGQITISIADKATTAN